MHPDDAVVNHIRQKKKKTYRTEPGLNDKEVNYNKKYINLHIRKNKYFLSYILFGLFYAIYIDDRSINERIFVEHIAHVGVN